jgi:uncharacterized protein YgbK (DUF1537 family)
VYESADHGCGQPNRRAALSPDSQVIVGAMSSATTGQVRHVVQDQIIENLHKYNTVEELWQV